MISERARAALIFVSVVIAGSVAAASLISTIRERRLQRQGDDPEAFLRDFPQQDASQSFLGAPALLFERAGESVYVNEPPEEVKVTIFTRKVPETGVLRRVLENRPYRTWRTARGSLVTRSEGTIAVGDRLLVVRSFRIDNGNPKADLWSTGPRAEKIGSIEFQAVDDKVVQGTIQLERTGQEYDVIIPRGHPNMTGLLESIRAVRPLTRAEVMALVKSSYNASSPAGG